MNKIDYDEITPSKEYIKGFNEGYFIAKHNPNFSANSISGTVKSDRMTGFNKGMMQYEVEKKMEKGFSFLSKDWDDKGKESGKDFSDKDIDLDKD